MTEPFFDVAVIRMQAVIK